MKPRRGAVVCAATLVLAACEAGPELPADPVEGRPSDGLLARPELQAVVELQVARDAVGLLAFLSDGEADVRARAAFALGSVQAPEAVDGLVAALADPVAGVRRDAAFALGQAGLESAVEPLAGLLSQEADREVRREAIEALGKLPSPAAAGALLALAPGPGEEALRTAALARLWAVVGVHAPESVTHLLARLDDPDGGVRLAAAYAFGRQPDPTLWSDRAVRLREALDGLALDDPAAMYLVQALGRLQAIFDGDRLHHWAAAATDWRTRTNATAALAGREMYPATQEILFAGLDDPSLHVAVTAAETLGRGNHLPSTVLRIRSWLEAHPDRLQVVEPLLVLLARMDEREAVFAWVDARAADDRAGWLAGLEALGFLGGVEAMERLHRAAGSELPAVAVRAVQALAQRWGRDARDARTHAVYFEAFREALRGPGARVAAPLLADTAFTALGSVQALEEGFRSAVGRGDAAAGAAIRDALEVAGVSPPAPLPPAAPVGPDPLRLDWGYLAELGRAPRLVLETAHGTVRVRLATEDAPLTVQTVARLAERGRYDGVPFHRVVPNFVVQGGDVARGDGGGGPGFAIRSEFGHVPFVRGTIGMASAGKDTEGSQFFINHVMTPHLDGAYTAFGWVEEGIDVLDRIGRHDLLVAARIERGG